MPEPPSSWAGSAHPPVKAILIGRAVGWKAGPVEVCTPSWLGLLRWLPPPSRALNRPGAPGPGPAPPGAESKAPPPDHDIRARPSRGGARPLQGSGRLTSVSMLRTACTSAELSKAAQNVGSGPLAPLQLPCLPAVVSRSLSAGRGISGLSEQSKMEEEDNSPQLVTPISVKAIISKIEAAQLSRAQEVISSRLSDILDNVNCVINRFQEELGYDLKDKVKSHQVEQKSKNRFILLEKIASFSKSAKTKEKHLYEILRWLADWGDSLTCEIRGRKSEKEEEAQDEWIDVMENVLPLSIIATKGGIESLISLCSTLIEQQKKRTQLSKYSLWQGWWGKRSRQSPPELQSLSPEQMLQDKQTTCMRVSEVTSMLQELLDSAMFNQGEVKTIRYMSAVVENLNKALILQQKENRTLETKYKHMKGEMTKELSSQRLYFQKSLKILENKKDALLKQVEILEKKYHDLHLIKHALEFQLKEAQGASNDAEDSVKTSIEVSSPFEKEAIPKNEPLVELPAEVSVSQLEPKIEEHLLLPRSPSPTAVAYNSDNTPSAEQPFPTTATHLRTADVHHSKDAESLPPALPPSMDYELSKQWDRPESLSHKDEQQDDLFQNLQGEECQVEFHSREQESPESSRKVYSESREEHMEAELSWQRRKRQWLKEEKLWLQRQKNWALLEWEHQEKLQQWEMDNKMREDWQRFIQPEKAQGSPRREPEKSRNDTEKMIFLPTSRRRELEKAEQSLVPPPSRVQSAHQGRRPFLPRSRSIRKSAPGIQRTISSADPKLKPWTPQVCTKPKKSASFPVTVTPSRKVAQASLQTSLAAPTEEVYWKDLEAQRKNPELPSEALELGPAKQLDSKSLALTPSPVGLDSLRLQYLCHKYITYRHFQRLQQEVINHIQVMQLTGATSKYRKLYTFLENTDHLQNLKLQTWTKKQKDLEEKSRERLSRMATTFPKLQQEWNAHLNIPAATSPMPRKSKLSPAFSQLIRSRGSLSKQPLEPFLSKPECVTPLLPSSQQERQMKAVWKSDVASSSHPVEKKTPLSLQWDQLGGYPDIPRLLALDVHSSYYKSLLFLKTQ
ncbi:PREDICTED: protein FAM186B [Elephantulus edwardii]|uniref:protein FAM186B n=1 Tax=Elephantulus edwardii TaxID=28737 RepID=UPI0003F06075|nr:PREDICTED: protein FAM186B [Elephantulus edwardii]